MRENATSGRFADSRLLRDVVGVVAIAVAGAAGYWLFPDNLALLTRVIAVALLVLSLDLVVGYCGVATLGHAALYGAGAYAAGMACLRGVTEPMTLILIGAAAGAGRASRNSASGAWPLCRLPSSAGTSAASAVWVSRSAARAS